MWRCLANYSTSDFTAHISFWKYSCIIYWQFRNTKRLQFIPVFYTGQKYACSTKCHRIIRRVFFYIVMKDLFDQSNHNNSNPRRNTWSSTLWIEKLHASLSIDTIFDIDNWSELLSWAWAKTLRHPLWCVTEVIAERGITCVVWLKLWHPQSWEGVSSHSDISPHVYRVYRVYRVYTAGAGHCQAPSAGPGSVHLETEETQRGPEPGGGNWAETCSQPGEADAGQGLRSVGGGGGDSMSGQVWRN